MATAIDAPWKAKHVREALANRYPESESGEFVILHEWNQIDALVIRCWTGREGSQRHAFEVKVSLADFRSELSKPGKRRYAIDVSHTYSFAMPWKLAQQVKHEIPEGLGLLGVIRRDGGHECRSIIRPRVAEPRPLTCAEVAVLVRHRASPPALRNAMMDRELRNQENRKLRARLKEATQCAVEYALASGQLVPGAMLAPEWSAYGLTVVGEPRKTKGGRVLVPTRSQHAREGSPRRDVDLGELLSAGYRVRPPEDEGEREAEAEAEDVVF